MALSAQYVTRGGLTVNDAYLRASHLHIAKVDGVWRVAFQLSAFLNEEMAAEAHRTLDEPRGHQCAYDPEGASPMAQAYAWLKNGTPEQGEEGQPDYVAAVPGLYADAVEV